MARNRKIVITGLPHLVTFRTEQGLPFMPNKLINAVIRGNMAKAQTLYPVTICKYIWTPNHAHLILIPKKPEDFIYFVQYLKRETAHAVNRLMGYRKRTIWAAGFDSPAILDFDACRKYCFYIDSNAVKDRLESTAKRYPGVKSYGAPKKQKVKRIARSQLKKVGNNSNWSNIARKLLKESNEQYELITEPDAWMKAYSEHTNTEFINKWIATQVVKVEKEKVHEPCVGRKELTTAPINKPYVPKKYSPKMVCLSTCRKLRIRFLGTYKALSNKAKELWDESKKLSKGLFAPGCLIAGAITAKEIGL